MMKIHDLPTFKTILGFLAKLAFGTGCPPVSLLSLFLPSLILALSQGDILSVAHRVLVDWNN